MKMKILYSLAIASVLSFSITNAKAATIEAFFDACQANGWAPFHWTWRVPEVPYGWPSRIGWDVDIQTSDSALFQFTAFTWGSASGDILYSYDGIVSTPKNNGISINNATTRGTYAPGPHYNYLRGYGFYKVPPSGRSNGTITLTPRGFSSQVQSSISISLPPGSCSNGPPPAPPTCQVSVGSQNQTIPLGDVHTIDFPNAGSGSAWSQFYVQLQNCNASTTGASFIFGGTADPVNSSLFRLSQVSGVATGLAVNIRRRNTANDIAPNTADVWTSIPGNRIFEYSARYVRPGDAPVTSGLAPAFATITLTYR